MPLKALTHSRVVTILNQRGLHARAAARFVKTAGEFKSDIAVCRNGQTVSGLSIMGLMMLAAGIGSEIEITCSGADAETAMQALADMIANKFEEE
ncbi:MAG: HPr family phosphocarrier protein [Rhodospirillaceae bacterium]|nr:HPr family phosphocarrier protein [Rhodospirillaceae bacterium]